MNEQELYLEELNICFEQYLKSKSISAYNKLWSKINLGKKIHNLYLEDYYSGNQKYSITDFDKTFSKQVKEMQAVKEMRKKVDVFEFKLINELGNIRRNLFDDLVKKCGYKVANGKYIIVKADGKIHQLFAALFSKSAEQKRKLEKKTPKATKDKYSEIRKYVANKTIKK